MRNVFQCCHLGRVAIDQVTKRPVNLVIFVLKVECFECQSIKGRLAADFPKVFQIIGSHLLTRSRHNQTTQSLLSSLFDFYNVDTTSEVVWSYITIIGAGLKNHFT